LKSEFGVEQIETIRQRKNMLAGDSVLNTNVFRHILSHRSKGYISRRIPERTLRLQAGRRPQTTPDHARSTPSQHVDELRCKEPEISIEIRWCPGHSEIEGNEKADKWAKLAADEPDSHGVEWFGYNDRLRAHAPTFPRPPQTRLLWTRLSSSGPRTARPSDKQKPDPTVARANRKLASSSTSGRRGTTSQAKPPVDGEKARRQMLVVPVQDPAPRTSL